MRAHPSRPLAVVAAFVAALWALFLLPPQQQAWSGVFAPRWLRVLDDLPVYDAIRNWLHSVGEHDFYLAFGALAAVSFVLIWWATGPAFAALGWSGRVLGWLTLLGAPVTALSYLNHPVDAPVHALWGAEAYALMLVGIWAVVVAIVAPRGRGIPGWERALLAATLPIMVVSTLALSYWPHGTLVGFGVEAAVMAALAPRAANRPRSSSLTPHPVPSVNVPADEPRRTSSLDAGR
ncbi:hypothetical protein [Agromyces bauzanensis]